MKSWDCTVMMWNEGEIERYDHPTVEAEDKTSAIDAARMLVQSQSSGFENYQVIDIDELEPRDTEARRTFEQGIGGCQ